MTVIFQPVGSGSLYSAPSPADYRIGYYLPGTVLQMSAGRALPAASASDGRREFTLTWNALLGTWLNQLEPAFAILCTDDVEFTDPNGNVWIVIRHPQQAKMTFTGVRYREDSTFWLWQTELRMVESV